MATNKWNLRRYKDKGSKEKDFELTANEELVDVGGKFRLKLDHVKAIKLGKMTDVLQHNKKASKKPEKSFFTIVAENDKNTLDFEAIKDDDRLNMIMVILNTFYNRSKDAKIASICDGKLDEIQTKLQWLQNNQLEFTLLPKPLPAVADVAPSTSKKEDDSTKVVEKSDSSDTSILPHFDETKFNWDFKRYKDKGSKEKSLTLNNDSVAWGDAKKDSIQMNTITEIIIGKDTTTLQDNKKAKKLNNSRFLTLKTSCKVGEVNMEMEPNDRLDFLQKLMTKLQTLPQPMTSDKFASVEQLSTNIFKNSEDILHISFKMKAIEPPKQEELAKPVQGQIKPETKSESNEKEQSPVATSKPVETSKQVIKQPEPDKMPFKEMTPPKPQAQMTKELVAAPVTVAIPKTDENVDSKSKHQLIASPAISTTQPANEKASVAMSKPQSHAVNVKPQPNDESKQPHESKLESTFESKTAIQSQSKPSLNAYVKHESSVEKPKQRAEPTGIKKEPITEFKENNFNKDTIKEAQIERKSQMIGQLKSKLPSPATTPALVDSSACIPPSKPTIETFEKNIQYDRSMIENNSQGVQATIQINNLVGVCVQTGETDHAMMHRMRREEYITFVKKQIDANEKWKLFRNIIKKVVSHCSDTETKHIEQTTQFWTEIIDEIETIVEFNQSSQDLQQNIQSNLTLIYQFHVMIPTDTDQISYIQLCNTRYQSQNKDFLPKEEVQQVSINSQHTMTDNLLQNSQSVQTSAVQTTPALDYQNAENNQPIQELKPTVNIVLHGLLKTFNMTMSLEDEYLKIGNATFEYQSIWKIEIGDTSTFQNVPRPKETQCMVLLTRQGTIQLEFETQQIRNKWINIISDKREKVMKLNQDTRNHEFSARLSIDDLNPFREQGVESDDFNLMEALNGKINYKQSKHDAGTSKLPKGIILTNEDGSSQPLVNKQNVHFEQKEQNSESSSYELKVEHDAHKLSFGDLSAEIGTHVSHLDHDDNNSHDIEHHQIKPPRNSSMTGSHNEYDRYTAKRNYDARIIKAKYGNLYSLSPTFANIEESQIGTQQDPFVTALDNLIEKMQSHASRLNAQLATDSDELP